MTKFKGITHFLAVAVATITAYFLTPAGIAQLHQYPHLVPIVAAIGAIGLAYHNPTNPA